MQSVLFLIKGLGRGGTEQLLASSARYLDRSSRRYEVAYLLPDRNALVGDLEGAGLSVSCLDGARGVGWIGRLRRLVAERRFDLVHAHSPIPAVVARLALPPTIPIVYTEHNLWERYHRATYWANLLTFFRNERVFAVSDHVRASIRYPAPMRFMPMPPVETMHPGLDLEAVASWSSPDGVRAELGIPEDAPVVGTVGHFTPKKAHEVLILAADRVRREVPDVRFVLVGYGPREALLRRQVSELGLERSVVFAGFREDAPRVTGAFDVFALSSTFEGLSVALLEAMAQGRPVVATRVGGIPEVVRDGEQGLLVPPGDPGALGRAIVMLLRDLELRKRFGEAGRRRAGEFDVRNAVRRAEEVYASLLPRAGR